MKQEKEIVFIDYCNDVVIPWLNRYVELESIHLRSMKRELQIMNDFNSRWYSFFHKIDTLFVEECISHSEVIIKSAKKQIAEYKNYVQKNK